MNDVVRQCRQYTLLAPGDCDPPHGLDLEPWSRDSIKVEHLTDTFQKNGFDNNYPALVGYPLAGRIQLASGTHRHEAARRAGILLPVTIFLRSDVEAFWGTDKWSDLIKDIAVKDLELAPVKDGVDLPGLDERVSLEQGYT